MGKVLRLGTTVRPKQRPLIAVSMQPTNAIELQAYLTEGLYKQADILEWRIDAWEDLTTLDETCIERTIKMSDRPLILTWRTREEGGLKSFEQNEYLRIYDLAITHGIAGIDIEVSLLEEVQSLLLQAKLKGIVTIGSRHDWSFPSDLSVRMNKMLDYPVDVLKYVTMVNTHEQAQEVLAGLNRLSQITDRPLIGMAMGDEGSFTRLEGFKYGSQLTFVQIGQASAPGQLNLEQVQDYFKNN